MAGGKRKRSNMTSVVKPAEIGDDSAARYLKGFSGMTNKEIHSTIYLVDDGLKFEEAVEKVKSMRVE